MFHVFVVVMIVRGGGRIVHHERKTSPAWMLFFAPAIIFIILILMLFSLYFHIDDKAFIPPLLNLPGTFPHDPYTHIAKTNSFVLESDINSIAFRHL